jgi:hypothetical protein
VHLGTLGQRVQDEPLRGCAVGHHVRLEAAAREGVGRALQASEVCRLGEFRVGRAGVGKYGAHGMGPSPGRMDGNLERIWITIRLQKKTNRP